MFLIHYSVITDNTLIKQVSSCTDLGVSINSSYTWHAYVESLFSHIQHRLYFLGRLRLLDAHERLMLLFIFQS